MCVCVCVLFTLIGGVPQVLIGDQGQDEVAQDQVPGGGGRRRGSMSGDGGGGGGVPTSQAGLAGKGQSVCCHALRVIHSHGNKQWKKENVLGQSKLRLEVVMSITLCYL